MRKYLLLGGLTFLLIACRSKWAISAENSNNIDFTIAFGSCNKHTLSNLLWDDITATNADVWIWGGDNVYADTDNMQHLREVYKAQNAIEGYADMKRKIPIIGTWDDHDYGLNDGGVEYHAKEASQQEFLDFMGISKDSPRRNQEGIYTAHDYVLAEGKIKVIVLDTRYFRTSVTPDTEIYKRLKPNPYGEGTMLGTTQWQWLEGQLKNSSADFNIVVSSVQFLSNEHGFECWGNFPHEVDRLEKMIAETKAKGVMILSGDRHISEFSKATVAGMSYPLIDFTSSGLTHAYSAFKGEPNPFRVGTVVKTESFGLLRFDLRAKKVTFEIRGDQGELLGNLYQTF